MAKISITTTPNADEVWSGIGGHFDSLGQIINEFVDNSISNFDGNTSDNDKSICISLTELPNNRVKVQIEDTGTGIKDLNAAFPATFPRLDFDWNDVAMMCFHELDVPNSLAMCLRILVVINCEDDFKPQFVYLKGAKNLR